LASSPVAVCKGIISIRRLNSIDYTSLRTEILRSLLEPRKVV